MKTKNYKPGQFCNIGGYFCRIKKVPQNRYKCSICEEQNEKQCISAYPKSGPTRDCLRKLRNNMDLFPKIIRKI